MSKTIIPMIYDPSARLDEKGQKKSFGAYTLIDRLGTEAIPNAVMEARLAYVDAYNAVKQRTRSQRLSATPHERIAESAATDGLPGH